MKITAARLFYDFIFRFKLEAQPQVFSLLLPPA